MKSHVRLSNSCDSTSADGISYLITTVCFINWNGCWHRVFPKKPNQTNISINGIRYSISFRSFNAGPTVATGVQAAVETSDINDKIDTTIIFGSSIPKRLDCKKLAGRSGKSVINLAVGGAKIPGMLKHMDQFFSGEHQYFQTEDAIPIDNMNINNVIFSVGTNDVLKIRHRVSSLYIPIQNMLRKAKAMFQCKIHFLLFSIFSYFHSG